MKLFKRVSAVALACLMMLSALCVLPVSAAKTTTVAEGKITQIVFGEIYTDADKGTKFDGNLVLEKNLGPTYFDGVRTGDWMEFTINVETAGDYNVCMVFGWLDHTGVYTIFVDGAEVGKIENKIPGTDWRVWTDSSTMKINLTEGEHTVRVVMGSDGPNVYGVKFTYVEPMPESIALNKPISADSVEKPQHEAIYAMRTPVGAVCPRAKQT